MMKTSNKQYWLFKSEPETFSFDDLKRCPKMTEGWDGVRNYQARNYMRDEVRVGDEVLFYHSSCAEPGIVGIAEVVRAGYPDDTAWDKKSDYYDEKSTQENPRWYRVDIKYKEAFKQILTLKALKEEKALSGMKVVQKGQRLSVQPVEKVHFEYVLRMANALLP